MYRYCRWSPHRRTSSSHGFFTSQSKFLFQSFQRSRLRIAVWHVEITRHTACCRCTAFCVDIRLSSQSRLTEVYVVVNNTWQHITTRSIDCFIKRCYGLLLGNFYNIAVFDDYIAFLRTAFVDNMSPLISILMV